MYTSEDINQNLTMVEQAVSDVAALIVPFPIISEYGNGKVMVFLSGLEFLRAVKKIKPVAVYLNIKRFEASEMVSECSRCCMEEDGDNDIEEIHASFERAPEHKALVRKWSSREGAVTSFTASFFIGIVEHRLSEVAGWIGDFEESVEQAFSLHIERERGRVNDVRAAQQGEISEKAKILAGHQLFAAPKSSKAKREFLAQQIFPDLDFRDIRAVVDLADLLSWYQSGNPKR